MKKTYPILAGAGLLISVAICADAQTPAPDLSRDLEIELALSALPPHLRAEATVYVPGDSQEFEVARKGTNGFHTFVSRNDPNASAGSRLQALFANNPPLKKQNSPVGDDLDSTHKENKQ